MSADRRTDSVLVVGPSWVGDMVMAQSLFISLRERDPDAAIDVVAPPWSSGLLGRMPEIRRAYILDVGHRELGWTKRRELARRLRGNRYRRAIVLPRSFKSALVPFWSGIPRRTGFRTEMRYGLLNDLRPLDRHRLDQTVKRFVVLGRDDPDDLSFDTVPRPAMTVDADNQRALVERLALDVSKPAVALMPGAEYGPAKQWPVEYFAELGRRLGERGFGVWIFGSPKEKPLGDTIASAAGAVNLCGHTRLEDVVDLAALACAAVSNDSGLMHVAAAVDRPLVALFGSSSPACTPPLSGRAAVEYLALECSPCFERHCPYGHYRCLREIGVERVLAALDRLHADEPL